LFNRRYRLHPPRITRLREVCPVLSFGISAGLGGAHGLVDLVAAPFVFGLYAAFVSVGVLWWGIPIGVTTTLLLRTVVRYRQPSEAAA
jgi:hypothetical protein